MRSLRRRRRNCSAELGALVVAAALAALPGCGGDDEPGYCSEVTELEPSVRDLGDVDVVNGGLDAVREALGRVEDDAGSVVDSAKGDFPDETDAISQATADVKATAGQLTDSPSVQEGARLVGDVEALVSSVDTFVDATRSECD
jgi:hypothetical protein